MIKQIKSAEIENYIKENSNVVLLDVRTEKEWNQTGIISQSKTITFFDNNGNFNVIDWMSKLDKIAKKNEPLIIICRSGRRSRIVSNYLNLKAGYNTIYHATNGILSWIAENKTTILPN